jgi:hypothetical protein
MALIAILDDSVRMKRQNLAVFLHIHFTNHVFISLKKVERFSDESFKVSMTLVWVYELSLY